MICPLLYGHILVSIHASLQQRGERKSKYQCCFGREVSIHASLQQRGEQFSLIGTQLGRRVSIHASLQQRGERVLEHYAFSPYTFQSTPHFSSEANSLGELSLAASGTAFQSTPHFSSEANPPPPNKPPRVFLFQSTPHFSSEANR